MTTERAETRAKCIDDTIVLTVVAGTAAALLGLIACTAAIVDHVALLCVPMACLALFSCHGMMSVVR